jgi:hypothetical protein
MKEVYTWRNFTSLKYVTFRLLSKNLKIKIYRTIILPVVLYGCETWSLTLREKCRLRVFENRVLRLDQIATHHVTRHNTTIHNILSTAPQLNISHKALETLPEDGNVVSKHVGATIHN